MLTFHRIMKTSQQVLCLYYKIENIFAWSYTHLEDTTLPISVEIQRKFLLKFLTMFSSKTNFCPEVTPYIIIKLGPL